MRAIIIAVVLGLALAASSALAQQDAGGADPIDKAFSSMLRDPSAAERTFRTHNSTQAKIGLVMMLRLLSAEPQQHDAEIRKLLNEITVDNSDDRQPVDLGRGYDGSVESLVPYIQEAAGPVDLPCGLFERHPPLIKVLAPYFFSTRDGALPSADCSHAEYPMPPSVGAFSDAVSAYDGGAFDHCTGTMRSGFARQAIMADVERQVLPRTLLENATAGGKSPEWSKLDVYPLQRWSYQSAWNHYAYLRLRDLFVRARTELAGYYRQRFGLAADEAMRAAHIGLWLNIADWTWQAQPVPSQLAVAIMDKDASPSLHELLAAPTPLDKMPEPALSLAVVRPETIAPLLAAHADVNARNAFGKTPLMTAAQFNRPDAARRLLRAGADVNATTAAPTAIADNSPRIADRPDTGCAEYGIAHGNRTALMYAAANGSLAVIESLLAAGADKFRKDSQGKTALDYLQGRGPVPANPVLTGGDRAAAAKLLDN
jgi:Ankyrin repeats (3 copies)/Ankyrin repeats (many copies)